MEEITVRRDVYEKLCDQASMFRNLQQNALIGWWRVDFDTREFFCSDFLQNVFRFDRLPVPFESFGALIHPDHRARVIRQFSMFPDIGVYEEEFPVRVKQGYVWIRSRLGAKGLTADGHTTAQGFMQYVDEKEVADSAREATRTRLRELLDRHNSVSRSLLTLLKNPDTTDVINETLGNLLRQFDGDRAYIFEYDWGRRTQTCIYEVTRDKVSSEQDRLQALPLDSTPWWTGQLSDHNPIILNDIDRIPSEASDERDFLASQGIRSIMAVPLVSKNGTWGYLGIDIVGRTKVWSDVDRQWFLSIANIISVCMELRRSEVAARREKEYFRSLYMNMPLGYLNFELIYDETGVPVDYRVLDINPAFEQITGRSRASVVGKAASELALILDREVLQDIDRMGASGSTEAVRHTRSGGGRYMESIVYVTERGSGTALFSDVTENIRAFDALRRSEEMLQNIYNGIPVGIEIYDKAGCLLDINRVDIEIFGLESKEQVLGINLFDNPNVPPEQKQMLRDMQNVEFELTYDFDQVNNGYYQSRYSGKKNLLVKGTILYSGEDRVENYILIIVDNTESLNTYRRLCESEFLFNYIAEFAEVGICRWIPHDRTIVASNQWYNNLNQEIRPIENLLAEAYTNVHPDDREGVSAFFRDALAGKADEYRAEIRIRHGEQWRWLRYNYKVKSDDGRPETMEIIGLNVDITELKQTEAGLIEAKLKAEDSDRLKSAFLANMSHEIRTPLNAIVGFSNLLTETDTEQEKRQYIGIIQKNNELLLQLISDILDLSKIEAGMMEVSFAEMDVNVLCEGLVKSYSVNPGLSVGLSFDRHLPSCRMTSDKNRVTQILSNYLSNAIKFTSEGGIRIGYDVRDGRIVFYVQDTGTGIAPEKLPTIFTRFVKLDKFVQGTGLGLSICKSLAEKLGGSVGVESELGRGSRFWLELPYEPKEADFTDYSLKKENTLKSEVQSGCKPLILVAEDTDSNFLLVSTILKSEYEVVRACDGVETVEKFFERKPDAVLMDVRMPRMDGLEATRKIRERDTVTPIVALTAFAFDSDRQKAFDAGCTDYMTKPINPSALKEKLRSIL